MPIRNPTKQATPTTIALKISVDQSFFDRDLTDLANFLGSKFGYSSKNAWIGTSQ